MAGKVNSKEAPKSDLNLNLEFDKRKKRKNEGALYCLIIVETTCLSSLIPQLF